jgi:hypothetical protein
LPPPIARVLGGRRTAACATVAGVGAWRAASGRSLSRNRGFRVRAHHTGMAAPDTAEVGDAGGAKGRSRSGWLATWAARGGSAARCTGRPVRGRQQCTPLPGFLGSRLEHTAAVPGFGEQGREVLAFLPGGPILTPGLLAPGQLESLASWTRSFHEVAAGFGHRGPWRYPRVPGVRRRPSGADRRCRAPPDPDDAGLDPAGCRCRRCGCAT